MSEALDSISSLLDDVENSKGELEQPTVKHDKLRPDPDQPRKNIDPNLLGWMVEDMKEHGIRTPLNIVDDPEKGEGYYLIKMGETRWTAAGEAGIEDIPVNYEPDSSRITDYDQVKENKLRKDLNPLELAIFIEKKIKDGDSLTVIAKNIGETKSTASKIHKLINLPNEALELYNKGIVTTYSALYPLLTVSEMLKERFPEYCEYIEDNGGISQKELERFVARMKRGDFDFEEEALQPGSADTGGNGDDSNQEDSNGEDGSNVTTVAKEKDGNIKDPYIEMLELHFSQHVGQVVKISQKDGEKGKITISYSSLDEFEGIRDRLNVPPVEE